MVETTRPLHLSPSTCHTVPRLVAGGKDESVQQPQWGPDGTLYFISDASGYWNLYMQEAAGGKVGGEQSAAVQ